MKKYLHLFLLIMLIISIYWLLTSTKLLLSFSSGCTFFLTILVILMLFYRDKIKDIINWLGKHQLLLWLLVILFQIGVLLSTDLMIRSDAAYVFNGSMKLIDSQAISDYLSRDSNNLFLFLYERFFYHLFNDKAIWVMQVLNILYVDISGICLYQIVKKHFNLSVANITLMFYILLLAATPQFVAMYTDIMVLPIVVGQLYCILDILDDNRKTTWQKIALFSAITAIGMFIRLTMVIIVIAFFMTYFLIFKLKKTLIIMTSFLIVFGVCYGGIKLLENSQNEVKIVKGRSKTALSFVDLGLTYTGTDQIDYQKGLALFVEKSEKNKEYDGRYDNQVVLSDIKRRLKNYTFKTFLGHVLLKQSLTTSSGTLSWSYKDASKEGAYYINPLYEKLKNNKIANLFRNYIIYSDRTTYKYYSYFLQIIMVLMVFGLSLSFKHMKFKQVPHLMLALTMFGGLLFLMIFEGGKSRYLIQFLPSILILSGIGWEILIGNKRDKNKEGVTHE